MQIADGCRERLKAWDVACARAARLFHPLFRPAVVERYRRTRGVSRDSIWAQSRAAVNATLVKERMAMRSDVETSVGFEDSQECESRHIRIYSVAHASGIITYLTSGRYGEG